MNIIATKIHGHPVHFATLAKSRVPGYVAHVFDHPQIRIADEQLKQTGIWRAQDAVEKKNRFRLPHMNSLAKFRTLSCQFFFLSKSPLFGGFLRESLK